MSLLGDVTFPTTIAQRQYDVLFTCSEHREALTARRQHTVHRNKRLEFATEQVGKLRYVTAVDGGQKHFPSVE